MPKIINYKLSRPQTLVKLAQLSVIKEPATTIYLPASLPQAEVEKLLTEIPRLSEAVAEITTATVGAKTGTVIFWGTTKKISLQPPFPIRHKFITSGYDTEELTRLLITPVKVGIILIRLGYYSIGIAVGEHLVAHKSGTGLVHARQRQGGSSANRFRRRRVEQTHHFLDRVVIRAKDMFEPQAKTLEYFVYGGARTTITELCKRSFFFKQFENRLLPPLLDIINPHFNVLKKAVADIWGSRVTEWRDE